jgi:hypothetical protein
MAWVCTQPARPPSPSSSSWRLAMLHSAVWCSPPAPPGPWIGLMIPHGDRQPWYHMVICGIMVISRHVTPATASPRLLPAPAGPSHVARTQPVQAEPLTAAGAEGALHLQLIHTISCATHVPNKTNCPAVRTGSRKEPYKQLEATVAGAKVVQGEVTNNSLCSFRQGSCGSQLIKQSSLFGDKESCGHVPGIAPPESLCKVAALATAAGSGGTPVCTKGAGPAVVGIRVVSV